MTRATIFHNPRCSKSRKTLALLEERDVDVEIVRYLEAPPSVKDLDSLCTLLDVAPIDITRTGESRLNELGLSPNDDRSRQEWLQILHDNPVLILRPIVHCEGKATIGWPPENVLDIL